MNIAIVGCGLIGCKRAAALSAEHKVVFASDIDMGKARKLAFSLPCAKPTDDWKKTIKDRKVNSVFVAVTHDNLAEISLAAINAGKHVLVEKPGGINTDELKTLIKAAKEKGVTVKVGFNHRFHPGMQKAKQLIESDAVGPLMFIRGRYGHGGRIGYENEWRADRKISGGGELLDQGSHLIDLSRWYLGGLIPAGGSLDTFFWDMKVEDNAFLMLKTKAGQIAWLHATWTEWKNMFCLEIYGRDGKLQIDGLGGSYGPEKLTYYRMLPEMGPPETEVFDFTGKDVSWELEFNDFLEAIKTKQQPCGSLEDALASMTIIEEYYKNKTT